MYIKIELLKNHISDYINNFIYDFEIDADKIADSAATKALAEIQQIIQNENYSDFDAIEKIVCVFEKYGLNSGCRHDF